MLGTFSTSKTDQTDNWQTNGKVTFIYIHEFWGVVVVVGLEYPLPLLNFC
jgi:hypothetical protein